jgi:hypothetical protein
MRTLLITALLIGCGGKRAERAPLVIPRTSGVLKIDGEMGEADWNNRSLRHAFTTPTGEQARPFSEVRWLHDDTHLYLGLYAADENIQTADFFDVHIGELALRIDATGKITPPLPGATAGLDRDGTLDDSSNDDEEWVLEVVIPLSATHLSTTMAKPVSASRCDTPKDGVTRCGSWSGDAKLE